MRLMLRILALACTVASGLVLAAWVVGRVLTDQFAWSQVIFWVPTEVALGAATVLWLVAVGLAWMGGTKWGRWRRRVVLAGLVLAWGYAALVVWRLPNALSAGSTGADRSGLHVLNWNVSGVDKLEPVIATLERTKPDLAVFVNPHMGVPWNRVYEAFGEPRALVQESGILVVSRRSIRRYGMAWLGVPSPEGATGTRFDPGRALYFEVDATAEVGRPIVVWVMDMPSDWRLARWESARRAEGAIAAWSGSEVRRDEMGNYSIGGEMSGFPTPDLIIGDMNAPRGSGSLEQIVGGMRSAFDEAGWGRSGSWPRRTPWLHLDQAFVGKGLLAREYRVFDAGAGTHRAQWVVLAGAVQAGGGHGPANAANAPRK
ncbi:MAG: endonuclease/exonuclease/phosphatase family protein [Phycisphaerales bacterium]